MVLNPNLYRVLIKHFGNVSVSNEGVRRVEQRVPGQSRPEVVVRGESYNVDCPLCGDTKGRLSISYLWLTKPPLSSQRVTALINCYNEGCEAWKEDFYGQFLDDLYAAELGLLDDIKVSDRVVPHREQGAPIPLPLGCVPLSSLDVGHPAIRMLTSRYNLDHKGISYISDAYGVMFTDEYDINFRNSQNRVIFPISKNGEHMGWQGRTIKNVRPRWYIPPGFVKPFYNIDRVPPGSIPILNEGILNAIFCGPSGIAMLGKSLNLLRVQELAEHTQSVIVATDPDTFTADNRQGGRGRVYAEELMEVLSKEIPDVRHIRWPKEIMDLAVKHNNPKEGDPEVNVPDAAELGFNAMRKIIEEVL